MTYAANNVPCSKMRELIERSRREELHAAASHFDISELMPIEEDNPGYRGAGVYAIYRADRTLIYIGMSLSNVAARVSKHRSQKVQASAFWQAQTAALVQTILVPRRWQSPSLEEYLIQKAEAYPDG